MSDPSIEGFRQQVFETYTDGLIGMTYKHSVMEPGAQRATSTAGTALVSSAIASDPDLSAQYTWAHRLVVVVSDGSSVLGLGDLGPRACLPVLETKCAFIRRIAGLDAIPLAFSDVSVEAIVNALAALAPSFGAVSIEDVASPRCFELERQLREALDCPVMHNDQHGTAVAVTAALRNAATVTARHFDSMRVVIVGAGAAGIATARLLLASGVHDVVLVDRQGIVTRGRLGLSDAKMQISKLTNPRKLAGGLAEALTGADALVGLSASTIEPGLLGRMNREPIILALANPVPEVDLATAQALGAVYGSGLATAPNCVTNLLAVPGIFHGALAAQAVEISQDMLLAAVDGLVRATQPLGKSRLVSDITDHQSFLRVSAAVSSAALATWNDTEAK